MNNRRFTSPVIDIPIPPEGLDVEVRQYLDKLRLSFVEHLQRYSTPGIIPVHEIDLIEPLRGGYGVPVGAVYVDANGALKMKQSGEAWAPLGIGTIQSGGAWGE